MSAVGAVIVLVFCTHAVLYSLVEFGLDVTIGAWIGRNKDQNEREILSVIDVAMRHANVSSVVVGNETIFRDDVKIDALIELIQKVRSSVSVPVTTGEIWSVWRDHPELVAAVDYIAVHILPYWQGVSEKNASMPIRRPMLAWP